MKIFQTQDPNHAPHDLFYLSNTFYQLSVMNSHLIHRAQKKNLYFLHFLKNSQLFIDVLDQKQHFYLNLHLQ